MRIAELEAIVEGRKLDSVMIMGSSDVQYFTGFRSPGSVLLFSRDEFTLFVPTLDYWRARLSIGDEVEVVATGKIQPGRGGKWVEDQPHVAAAKRARGRVGADIGAAGYRQVKEVLEASGGVEDLTEDVWRARMVKDADEIEAIIRALRVTEKAMRRAAEEARPGFRDYDIVAAFEEEARRLGAERMAFDGIVAVGTNSANPHAEIRGETVREGDAVVIDVGIVMGGYCSDMTRTISPKISRELKEMLDVVVHSVEEAIDSIWPGIEASSPDEVARKILASRGLDRYFIHGLGHGIGIDVHEPPRLAPGEGRRLEKGMVVTVEPGVYIPGRFGIRVEEMVLVEAGRARTLNMMPRILEFQ